jgi:hypothetical protein
LLGAIAARQPASQPDDDEVIVFFLLPLAKSQSLPDAEVDLNRSVNVML